MQLRQDYGSATGDDRIGVASEGPRVLRPHWLKTVVNGLWDLIIFLAIIRSRGKSNEFQYSMLPVF